MNKNRSIRIIFFNPITCKKRVKKFTFVWNYFNHCWNVTTESILGESIKCRDYYGDPINLINRFIECLIKENEYVTIKSY